MLVVLVLLVLVEPTVVEVSEPTGNPVVDGASTTAPPEHAASTTRRPDTKAENLRDTSRA